MGTNRTRRTRKSITGPNGLTEAIYQYFSHGTFFEAEGFDEDKTEEELSELWLQHQDQILARFMEESRKFFLKGRRPRAYFERTLTEPRLFIGKSEGIYINPMIVNYDGFEGDYAYLKRLGLLEPWELETNNE